MPTVLPTPRIYRLFADILEYPKKDSIDAVRECADLLSAIDAEAASKMEEFSAFTMQTSLGYLQEAYTSAFDLQPVSFPYTGYQLFGESYKRGSFMVSLKEKYREHGFPETKELPDHLTVLLRFLAVLEEKDERELNRTLVVECMVPSLEKMEPAFEDKGNPYGEVIRSLLATVREMARVIDTRIADSAGSTVDLQATAPAMYEEG